MRSPTALARAIDLESVRNAADRDVAARFHGSYRPALPRVPGGSQVFHGVPFALGVTAPPGPDRGPAGGAGAGRRWILLDGPTTIDLHGGGPAGRS